MPCGFDLERTTAEAQSLKDCPGWYRIAATSHQRVWAVDGNAYFNRSGPRIVDSLELLAHLVHPELVPPPAAGHAIWRQFD
jgi:iron complex transport system substrate-binding protein